MYVVHSKQTRCKSSHNDNNVYRQSSRPKLLSRGGKVFFVLGRLKDYIYCAGVAVKKEIVGQSANTGVKVLKLDALMLSLSVMES